MQPHFQTSHLVPIILQKDSKGGRKLLPHLLYNGKQNILKQQNILDILLGNILHPINLSALSYFFGSQNVKLRYDKDNGFP